MKLGEAADMRVEAIPTGALSLDLALGVGGLPRSRVTEICGPEGSGKTTICLHFIGSRTRVSVKKNKVAPPFRQADFDIMYNEGISRSGDLLDLAIEHDIIQKRCPFYSYGDTRLGQGRENAKTFLQENDQLFAAVFDEIRRTSALPSRPATIAAPGAG